MYGMLLYMNMYSRIHKMKGITHGLFEVLFEAIATCHKGLTLITGV